MEAMLTEYLSSKEQEFAEKMEEGDTDGAYEANEDIREAMGVLGMLQR